MNSATLQARVLVDELIRQGVREAVLCPGSRSTPLAFALLEAEQAGRLSLHMRIDERAAAFLALGLTAHSQQPVVVACTSGSAVANFHPAVVEARYNHQQLVVVTANRPVSLHGVGAQQTINQDHFFGTDVVGEWTFPDILQSEDAALVNARWRAGVCRVLAQGATKAGPVHIDVPFREPLMPESDGTDSALPAQWEGRPQSAPWVEIHTAQHPIALDLSQPTVVLAGQGSWEIPELAGVPTLCEPGGRSAAPILHPLIAGHIQPAQIVVVGKPTLHRPVMCLLAQDVPQIVLTPDAYLTDWADVSGQARAVGSSVTTTGECPAEWVAQCRELDRQARAHVAQVLAEEEAAAGADGAHAGLVVANIVGQTLAEDPEVLGYIGSSNPVRDIALTHPEIAAQCWVNRGASGIDGNISTALGLALRHPGPVLAFLGDLTALHDASGMLIPDAEEPPRCLTIVVANDSGGGIFATLEPGEPAYAADFERLFGTPHSADIASLAAGYGAHYEQCTWQELSEVVAVRRPGVTMVEVRTARAERHRLAGRVGEWRPAGEA